MADVTEKDSDSNNSEISRNPSRLKILEAAEEVFARNGFDGARVDEIAQKAGLNKAMLYYYFKSKELLLEALVKKSVAETEEIVEEVLRNSAGIQDDIVAHLLDRFVEFIERKKNILRIISIEGFKNIWNSRFNVFSHFDPIYRKVIQALTEVGKNTADTMDILIKNYFISSVPLIMFYIQGDQWAAHYGVDRTEVRKRFFDIFKGIHRNLY